MQNQLDFTTENYNNLLKEAFRASIEYDQLEKQNTELEDDYDNLQKESKNLEKNISIFGT